MERASDPAVEATVDVVIVNWNSGAHLRECVAALDRSSGAEHLNLIVVDNDSTDHSADGLQVGRANLQIVRNPVNRGFAVACNQGARLGAAAYLLFLNPDVRLEADAVQKADSLSKRSEPSGGRCRRRPVARSAAANPALLRPDTHAYGAVPSSIFPGPPVPQPGTATFPHRLGSSGDTRSRSGDWRLPCSYAEACSTSWLVSMSDSFCTTRMSIYA